MNQNCRVCGEVAAGYHFGAFTCEGCKSFFGRTYNNRSSIGECKNNNSCVINKKNRTSCKSCRLKKCFAVGMSKSGSRYGRRSNWFKIHCLLQDQGNMQLQQQHQQQQIHQQQQQAHPTSDNGIPNIATQTNNSISNTISQQPMSPLALTTAHHHHHHPRPQQHQPSHQQLQQQLSQQQHEQQLQEQPPHQPSQQQLQLYNHLLHHSADAAAAHQFHQLSQLNQLSEMFPMLQSVILTAAIMQAAQQQRPS